MDYFGWTVSKNLFLGQQDQLRAINYGNSNKEDFEPNQDFWHGMFQRVENIIDKAQIPKKLGACFHFTQNAAELLSNLGFNYDFITARNQYPWANGFELGMHSAHKDNEVLCSKDFLPTFKHDLKIGQELQITGLVEHTPIGESDKTSEAVQILTTPEMCEMISNIPFPICWENKADYRWKPRYYGSLKQMVRFRNALKDALNDVGYPELIKKHLFTFDTGHLLIWRNHNPNPAAVEKADEEIAEFLPEFAKHLKVFHIQLNNGVKDHHVTPFSNKYMDHPSREGLTKAVIETNSEKILEWMKICEQNRSIQGRHLHLEAGTLPYDISQYLEFAQNLKRII